MEQSIPIQPGIANLQTRVVNVLSRPKEEWPLIAAEPRDISALYRNYIALLAAIPAICGFIGTSVVGTWTPLYGYVRSGFAAAFVFAVLRYVLTLVGVYVAAFVIAKLAPSFQSEPDTAQAVKLVAYSSTPAWVAGVLLLYPPLGLLVFLASLYGIYLAYTGIGPVMKTPADKVIAYLIVSAVVLVVVYLVVGAVVAAAAAPFLMIPRAF